jgi:hypothetical protein
MLMAGDTEPKPCVRLSKMTKMTVKIKIGQKSFFGAIFGFMGKSDTENLNFAKILPFGQCLPEIRTLKVVK